MRAIIDWNALSPSIVLSATLNQFEGRLDKHWGDPSFFIPDQSQLLSLWANYGDPSNEPSPIGDSFIEWTYPSGPFNKDLAHLRGHRRG